MFLFTLELRNVVSQEMVEGEKVVQASRHKEIVEGLAIKAPS